MNNIIQKKAEFALFCTNQKYYEHGERAGKVLAHRVKQMQASNIPSIFDKNKLITSKKKRSMRSLKHFIKNYTHLKEKWRKEKCQSFSLLFKFLH